MCRDGPGTERRTGQGSPAHDLPGLERDGRPFRVHDDDGRVQTEGHVRDGEVEKGPVEVRTMDVVVR